VGALRISVVPWGLPVLVGVYFVAGKLGLTLAFVHASATAVWPPTGIALAATLLLGYRVWPALFVGAFLVNVTTEGSVWTSLGIASGNTLEGLLGAFLVTRFANGRNVFSRAREILLFTALAGFLSTAVSATIGVTSLSLGGYASWDRFGAIWLTWWLGDVAGALVVAPVLVLWCTERTARLTGVRIVELALLLGSTVVLGGAVFGGLGSALVRDYPLEFLCIPLLVLAAFRFGPREAATCVALLSVIATWGTLRGAGPFVWDTQNESLLLLQAFMGSMAIMTLLLAAVIAERGRAEEALVRVASIVEFSDDAIIGKTLDGMITSWNAGAERLYGYSAREVVGRWPIALIIPPERRDELSMILERLARGERVDHYETAYETVQMAKDGRRIDVSVTVSPIRDPEGRIVGVSSIARDITQRKQVEAAVRERDALRYVASLAAAAAHEINNPLAVVVGQAQLLADEVDAARRRRIEEILEATRRIQGAVDQLKRINRLELMDAPQPVPEMLDLDKSSSEGSRPGGSDLT
jgi:PAS domain S-box-containing protein